MIRFTIFIVLFFLLSQFNIAFSQQWALEIVRENIVGAWILPGDFDNDDDDDLLIQNGDTLFWYENPSWAGHTITTGINWLNVGPVGDMDQDGDLDVLFGGQNNIGWCENLGDAQNWQRHIFDTVNNQYPTPLGLAHLTSDAYLDVTAYTIFDFSTVTGDACWYANPIASTLVNDDRDHDLPIKFTLFQNHPNPFNPRTMIGYSIPQPGFVELKIYNMLGRIIQTLVNELQQAGSYSADFDASQLSNGVYFYQLKVGNRFSETKKMLYLK